MGNTVSGCSVAYTELASVVDNRDVPPSTLASAFPTDFAAIDRLRDERKRLRAPTSGTFKTRTEM